MAAGRKAPSPYPSILSALRNTPSVPRLSPGEEYLKNIIAPTHNNVASPLSFLGPAAAAKPRIFVSYHHGGDRLYYDEFSRVFADTYEVCHDNSVERVIDSDNPEYVMRLIRENYLTGSSCTVVLCGAQTRWRKFVDWEIKATLDKRHGLVGVILPTNRPDIFGGKHVPDRFKENMDSGFALCVEWDALMTGGPNLLRRYLHLARLAPSSLISNEAKLRRRNG